MSNVITVLPAALPVPGAAGGVSAAVDVRAIGGNMTFSLNGNDGDTVLVQASPDGAALWSDLVILANNQTVGQPQDVVVGFIRLVRVRVDPTPGVVLVNPQVSVTGQPLPSGYSFSTIAIPVPAADGVGASVDVRALAITDEVKKGPAKSIVCSAFDPGDKLTLEASADGNIPWAAVMELQQGKCLGVAGSLGFLRIRRARVPAAGPRVGVDGATAAFMGQGFVSAGGGAVGLDTFGAIGDGVADDTAALQAAASSGAIVALIGAPGKTYKTTAAITIDRPVQLQLNGAKITSTATPIFNVTAGAGKAAALSIIGADPKSSQITAAAGGTIVQLSGDFTTNVGDGLAAIHLQRLGLIGNGASSVLNTGAFPGTNLQDGLILIEESYISGHGGIAVNVGQSVYFIRIERNEFQGNQQAVFLDNNVEASITDNFFSQAAGGGATLTLVGPMQRVQGNYFYRSTNTDASVAPDILLQPQAAWASASGGQMWIENNRFGAERENFDRTRYRIRLLSAAGADPTHVVIGGPVFVRGNRFLGGSATATITAPNTVTATVTLPAGRSTQGLLVGDLVVIINSATPGFNGQWAVASIVDAQNFTFTLPAAINAAGVACAVFAAQQAAIRLDNPHLQWDVSNNFFNNYGVLISDAQTQTAGFGYGQSQFRGNTVFQTFPGFQVFANEGRGFTVVEPPAEAAFIPIDGVARINEKRSLKNRVYRSERLDLWLIQNALVPTVGQADPWGTTRATQLALSGVNPSSQALRNTLDITGLAGNARVTVKLWAKAGTLSTMCVGVFDSTLGQWKGNLWKLSLGADWKQYKFVANGITAGNNYLLYLIPGDVTFINGNVLVCSPQVSDDDTDYYPTPAAAIASDATAGNRFEQAVILTDLKSQTHDGATLPGIAATGLGGAGAAQALDAGSNDVAGVITLTAGAAPAALGTATLSFSRNKTGQLPTVILTLQDGTGAWNARVTARLASTALNQFVINWDNNAVALTAASTYKIHYQVTGRA